MKNHIKTIDMLNDQLQENQGEVSVLREKIDKLNAGIALFTQAKRVLSQKATKIGKENIALSNRISYEIDQMAKKHNTEMNLVASPKIP